MARQMDIAPRTMSHIIKQTRLGAFKRQTKGQFMHSHPRKPADWYQGLNKVIIRFGGEYPMRATLLNFVKRALKQRREIIDGTF